MKKRIVVKVGTSTLTEGGSRISRGKIEDIARQVAQLRINYEIILVTSGAIAAARQFAPQSEVSQVAVKQALAAIGQLQLMRMYQEIFRDYQIDMAQCLLTYYDFKNEESRSNMTSTINTLLQLGYLPVINENDTVATDEIKFGDNDKLAALTAILLNAEILILATDIDGLFEDDPKTNPNARLIKTIQDINTVRSHIADTKSEQGSGGMLSKINSAELAQQAGIETWIINGAPKNFLTKAIHGERPYTKVVVAP